MKMRETSLISFNKTEFAKFFVKVIMEKTMCLIDAFILRQNCLFVFPLKGGFHN